MKQLLLSLLALGVGYAAKGQFVLKSEMHPSRNYETSSMVSIDMTLNFSGDAEMMEKIKASGTQIPMIMKGQTQTVVKVSTGDHVSARGLDATITYTKSTIAQELNGKPMESQADPLSGMVVRGFYDKDLAFAVDTIVGTQVDPRIKEVLQKVLAQVQTQILFPSTPLSVGDSFDQTIPVDVPIPGYNAMKMELKNHYTLKSLDEELAKFDVKCTITFGFDNEKLRMNALGEGYGVALFSRKHQVTTQQDLNMDMKMTIDTNGMNITSQVSSHTIQSTIVSNR